MVSKAWRASQHFPSLSLSLPLLSQSTSLLHASSRRCPKPPTAAPAHVSEVRLLAGAFL